MTHNGIDVLDRTDCDTLLRQATLGRVGVKIADEPAILPVYYAMQGDDIVFRTSPGTKLDAAVLHTKVAFEIDDDAAGWSVLVVGHAEELRDGRDVETALKVLGTVWPTGERERVVRIRVEKVTGRRLRTINLTRFDGR